EIMPRRRRQGGYFDAGGDVVEIAPQDDAHHRVAGEVFDLLKLSLDLRVGQHTLSHCHTFGEIDGSDRIQVQRHHIRNKVQVETAVVRHGFTQSPLRLPDMQDTLLDRSGGAYLMNLEIVQNGKRNIALVHTARDVHCLQIEQIFQLR